MSALQALRCLVLALTVLAAGSAFGQSAQLALSSEHREWLLAHPTIQVGVYDNDWRPFEQVRNARAEGLAPDLLKAVADSLGLSLETKVYGSWQELLDAACAGHVDVVMNVVLTSERTHCMVFTREYAVAPMGLAARLENRTLDAKPDLAGLRIAVERDVVTAASAIERYPEAVPVFVRDGRQALKLVSSGHADVYAGSAHVIQQQLSDPAFQSIHLVRAADMAPMSLHFGVPNAKQPLVEALDIGLRALPEATVIAIRMKWLQELDWSSGSGPRFSLEQQKALSTPMKVGVPSNWAPIAFIDEHGEPSGISGDYLQRFILAGARGLTFVSFDSWSDVRSALREGRVDAAMAVPASVQGARDGLHFSEPFLAVANVVVTPVGAPQVFDLRDLDGRRVALSDPDRLGPLVLAQAPGAAIVRAPSASAAMQLVKSGGADAYVGNLAVVDRYLHHKYAGKLQIAAPAGIEDRLVFAARHDQALMVSAFDRLLLTLSAREREAIRNNWFAVHIRSAIDWYQLMLWAVPIGLMLLTAGLVHGVGHLRMRREVAQRRLAEDRLDRVTQRLPAVVYQFHLAADGTSSFPFIAGDTYSLFGVELARALQDERLVFERLHQDDRPRLIEEIRRAAAAGDGISIQFRVHSPQGLRWVLSKGEPMESTDGGCQWSGYWVDVTESQEQSEELRTAKSEAEKASQAKADFLATISHEIRTPMSGFLGMLEVLSHTLLDGEQAEILDAVNRSAAMLRQLLDDTLDFSKIEAGALTLELLPVDLRQLVASTQQMFAAQARSKGIQLVASVAPDVGCLHLADGVRLQQILFNLVGNALKFTSRGGVFITVKSQRCDSGTEQVEICVRDTGLGIAPAQLQRVFEPFTQAETSTSRRYGGTGLGLSISRHLAMMMQGSLTLQSEEGMGTQATLVLALSTVESVVDGISAAVGAGPLSRAPSGRRWRILVAEDHETNQDLMRWRMRQLDVECVIVEDGAQAIDALRNGAFDLVLTDCQMPVVDGYGLARHIRSIESSGQHLPIIALTANAMQTELRKSVEAGMDELLTKPVAFDILRAVLANRLNAVPCPQVRPDRDIQSCAAPDGEPVLGAPVLPTVTSLAAELGSESLARHMLASFRAVCLKDLDALTAAANDGDAGACEQLLHRIAGGAGALSARGVAITVRGLLDGVSSDGVAVHLDKISAVEQGLRAALLTLPEGPDGK